MSSHRAIKKRQCSVLQKAKDKIFNTLQFILHIVYDIFSLYKSNIYVKMFKFIPELRQKVQSSESEIRGSYFGFP